MSASRLPLPEYANPPVVEVVLSIQFEPIQSLGVPQLGMLWAEYKERFPKTEEHPPLPSLTETFGLRPDRRVDVKFEMLQAPPTPRLWFLTDAGDRLVQVQKDRFIYNWRKIGEGNQYPRYKHVREAFISELELFKGFLQREQIGELRPNQCEVTYVNHLESGIGWDRYGEVDRVIATWSSDVSETFLPEPENVTFATQYVIPRNGGPIGRLHVSLQPAYRLTDGKTIIKFELTARGSPLSQSVEGTLQFLDLGHEWIVRGFTSLTAKEMHEIWGRRR